MRNITLCCFMVFFLFAGCAKKTDQEIVIASKPVTEQFILAEMLTLLIEEHTDLTVKQSLGIGGGTSNIHPALLKGEDANVLYQKVKEAYYTQMQLHWSGLYGFNNTYGVAVAEQVARQYNLRTVSDLTKVSDKLVFAANPDFLEREDGFVGLTKAYGLTFKVIKEIDIGLRYEAVRSEGVDVITVFSTDGRLKEEPVVVLDDDRSCFTSYHAATIVRNEQLKQHPELEQVLEKLTGKISNEEMIALNYQVEIEKQDPKVVAKVFLKQKGLL